MTYVSSRVLAIGKAPESQIGIDSSPNLTQATLLIQKNSFDVVVVGVSITQEPHFVSFYKNLKELNETSQILLILDQNNSHQQLIQIVNEYDIFRIAPSINSPALESLIIECLEYSNFQKQNKELENLFKETNEKLKSFQTSLEDKVEKRQKFLLEARRKLFVTNDRIDSLKQTLLGIYKSMSLGEMEVNLNQTLSPSMQLTWVRIIYSPQDEVFVKQSKEQLQSTIYQASLFNGETKFGSIFFLRSSHLAFLREEQTFLNKVAEAASVALVRLSKLEQTDLVKNQWAATFNAISAPVAIINSRYEVAQYNLAFQNIANQSSNKEHHDNLQGTNCYEILFNKKSPCIGCKLGTSFRMDGYKKGQTLEVFSQKIGEDLENQNDLLYVNIYQDVTEQLKLKRQILESAKLAELGTIGSSIAHELNNPLGGMLSIVQLMKMDLKESDPIWQDIVDMENGVRRCRDIVQNLLGFSRNPDRDEKTILDLREIISRALKIVELQTRSKGIEVRVLLPENEIQVFGHFNLLSQALKNIIQNSIDSIIEKSNTQKGFHGVIEVRGIQQNNQNLITIIDNGLGIESQNLEKATAPFYTTKNPSFNPGLGLSVAQQIILEHSGALEISSQPRQMTMVKIILPSPVFK